MIVGIVRSPFVIRRIVVTARRLRRKTISRDRAVVQDDAECLVGRPPTTTAVVKSRGGVSLVRTREREREREKKVEEVNACVADERRARSALVCSVLMCVYVCGK